MQVSLETIGSLERKLTIRIPEERLESRVRERMRELGHSVRLKGFRPGKIPPKVIEQRFGQQVRNEALREVIGSSYQEAVRQENLRPALPPAITPPRTDSGEIEFTATFEVVPEIGRIDVSSLEIVRTVSKVEEQDVDRMIETLRLQRRQWLPVQRGAAPGDMVLFEYSATIEGVRHPATGSERAGTIIGSGAFHPQVDAALTGLAAGASTSVAADFPAGFRDAALAGRHALIDLHVIKVQEGHLPVVDDAFAASFGIREGGVTKFRADVRANLERELDSALRGRIKADAVDKLVAAHDSIEVPRGMIEAEARALHKQQGERGTATPGVDAFMGVARKRVLAFLLLNELARQNDIRLDKRRFSEALATLASTYEEPQKVVELYSKDEELKTQLANRVLEDQVVEWVAGHAHAREQMLPFEQVMNSQPRA
jgi:trigger factor